MRLLEGLQARRGQLDSREKSMEMQLALLAATEAKLDTRIASLNALKADIQAFVKSRLSAHEYPREIAFRDSLPLTTTGKVIRRLLREEG